MTSRTYIQIIPKNIYYFFGSHSTMVAEQYLGRKWRTADPLDHCCGRQRMTRFVCPPREDRRFTILGVGEKGVPHSYWRRKSAHLTFNRPLRDAKPLCSWDWGTFRLEERTLRRFFLDSGRKSMQRMWGVQKCCMWSGCD